MAQSHDVLLDLYIKASAEQVYNAVTLPEELIKWWPLKCSGSPLLNEVYNLNFTDQYDWYGIVTASEPFKHFEITMTKSDQDWDGTQFGFILTPRSSNLHLQFYHKGWKESNEHYRHSTYCWANLLRSLKDYLESGKIVAFEDRS